MLLFTNFFFNSFVPIFWSLNYNYKLFSSSRLLIQVGMENGIINLLTILKFEEMGFCCFFNVKPLCGYKMTVHSIF